MTAPEGLIEASYEGVTVAGLLVVARDTGEMLLAQRAYDETDDPEIRETFEMPGGHLEDGEEPFAGAVREFTEEVGVELPAHEVVHGWRDGSEDHYQGFVVAVEARFEVPDNSWDPDEVQSVVWATPDEAVSMNLRPEFAGNDLHALVGYAVSGNEESFAMDDTEITDEMVDEPELSLLDLAGGPIPVHGVLAPEDVESGDARGFNAGAVTARNYRLPFMWQEEQNSGHDRSVVVGSVDRLMRKDGLIHWEGALMPTAKAGEFAELLAFFGRFGVSVDGDRGSMDAERTNATKVMWFDAVRAAGLTAVSIPAFAEAYVAFGPHPEMPEVDSDEFAVLRASGAAVEFATFDRGPGWVTHPREPSAVEPEPVNLVIPESLGASAKATLDVLPVGHGLKMAWTYAGKDSAEVVKVSGNLGSVTRFLWEFGYSRLVDEAVGEMATPAVVQASVAARINEADPDEAWAEMRSVLGNVTLSGVSLNDLLAGAARSGASLGLDDERVSVLAESLVVSGAEPPGKVGAFAAFQRALVHGLVSFDRGPGWVTHPAATKRIHDFWTKKGQPGYAKIRWGTPGDFTRAKKLIGEKIGANSPEDLRYLNQIIAQWHYDALGYWPGELGKPGNPPDTKENRRRAARHAASLTPLEAAHEASATLNKAMADEEVILTASAGKRVLPPLSYFERHPDSGALAIDEPDENGIRRTYGYAGEWGVCHIGFEGRCVEMPADPSGGTFPDFHLGRTKVETDGGAGYINTGLITYMTEHRDGQTILSETAQSAHFDDITHAWAAVRLGEDERGVWFSGVVLPHVPADDLVVIEAAGQVSGEWKHSSLRTLLAVSVPGFGVSRAEYEGDEVVSLVASAFGAGDCEPTPAERMAAMAKIDAEVRFAKLKEQWS